MIEDIDDKPIDLSEIPFLVNDNERKAKRGDSCTIPQRTKGYMKRFKKDTPVYFDYKDPAFRFASRIRARAVLIITLSGTALSSCIYFLRSRYSPVVVSTLTISPTLINAVT